MTMRGEIILASCKHEKVLIAEQEATGMEEFPYSESKRTASELLFFISQGPLNVILAFAISWLHQLWLEGVEQRP